MAIEPTPIELIEAAKLAIRGRRERDSDWVRGSDYESLNGPSAMIWSRMARRDTDLFNACLFNTATGDDLTRLAIKRYGKDRIFDSRGTGFIRVRRPTAVAGAGTFWKGTRVCLFGSNPRYYQLTEDTPYTATETYLELPVEAMLYGPGTSSTVGSGAARFEDLVEDSTWSIEFFTCGEGTLFEEAGAFRARIRRERREERVGQATAIEAACRLAGAEQVALFRSDYAGDAYDYGLNFCYVGNTGYIGTPELVKACSMALEGVRVLGDSLQVLPMERVEQDVNATVYLTRSPSEVNLPRLERILTATVRQYFNDGDGRFGFTLGGIRTAITRTPTEVQRVVLKTPTADDVIVTGTEKNFPGVLNRYVPGVIRFEFTK